ncbi:3039_t:CDS:2, partial [Cetraspora pellucida]
MLFDMIGHTDNESSGGRLHPDYTLESLGEESLLSEQLKNFSDLVCERRRRFIDETFKKSKSNHLLRPIPVTAQEEAATMDEANMSKEELLAIINSLLSSVNIPDSSKYRGLKQKNQQLDWSNGSEIINLSISCKMQNQDLTHVSWN